MNSSFRKNWGLGPDFSFLDHDKPLYMYENKNNK